VSEEMGEVHSDIVYVGGGNTLYMLRKWKSLGIDKLLWQAYQKGVIMSGLSAGANCWFSHCTSDSRMLTDPTFKDYIRVKGLGWYKLIMSPHHINEPKRKPGLIKQIKKHGGVGLALDDFAALEIINDQFRIITSKPIAKAFKVYKEKGRLIYEKIPKNKFLPLSYLIKP
jgi:dipeptidase E